MYLELVLFGFFPAFTVLTPRWGVAGTRLKREHAAGWADADIVTSPGVCAAQAGLPSQLTRAWAPRARVSVARSDTRAGADLFLVLLCYFISRYLALVCHFW